MSERRLENRFLCADLVRVSWSPAEGGAKKTAEAVLEDISHVGGCVQVEEAVPEGSAIRLSIGDWNFDGAVSYCAFRECGYFVGITFCAGSAWSADRVLPQHLVDLRSVFRHE
jgi:hypothetical protein